ncbi:MAG: glycoside hydrolase, partial [Cytophagales bacterium]|nr:glycoside hydrolase [Cytophagales bacterium]
GYGWDDLATYNAPAFITAARQTSTPTRRVRVSNEEDFFRDVQRTYPSLPAQSVSFGNEWDVYPASMNETTAQVRRATEKLRAAEALAALVALHDSTFADDLTAMRRAAWDAFGLYWEHDWTADGPVTRKERADWQITQKNRITAYVDTLLGRGVDALGRGLQRWDRPRFYVFNPLGWVRSDVADVPHADAGPVTVVDLQTGAEAASQRIRKGGRLYLRIWAQNVPSAGYKAFEIRPGEPVRRPLAARARGEVIANAHYRLRLRKSGIISDLTDRKAGNRLVVGAPDGRGCNDLGSVNTDAGRPVVLENAGPVSVTLKAVSEDPIPHTVRVTLFANSPRIEIEDSIGANFSDVKTWTFSFGLKDPTTRHEELGAILTARKESRGGHYADRNARYDWLTFNHFADLSEKEYGITLSNVDCSFFRLGGSTPDSLWENSSQLSALAGGQVDGPRLGILSQNGATAFRYQFALTTHQTAFDAVAAMRFSLEHQNPLVTGAVTGTADRYPPVAHSLLAVSDQNVLLWSLKPSEEGIARGLVARFWNLQPAARTPSVKLIWPVRQAWQTTHLETDERTLRSDNGMLQPQFAPWQLNTYRLHLQR